MLSKKLKDVYHVNKIKDIGLTIEETIKNKFDESLNKDLDEIVMYDVY